mgnify:CR=1 FL=1
MKRPGPTRLHDLRGLEKGLARPLGSWQMSPNDLLVQIALPMVLVLAIIINLLDVRVPIVKPEEQFLEPWKQQLFLRIDRVMNRMEQEWRLPLFQSPDIIRFGERYPSDPEFQILSRRSQELATPRLLTRTIYKQALAFDPRGIPNAETRDRFREVWDKGSDVEPANPGSIPPELIIDGPKREFAYDLIEKRLAEWQSQVQGLQWAVVSRIAESFTLEDMVAIGVTSVTGSIDVIAKELNERGYPLLPSVVEEYGQ